MRTPPPLIALVPEASVVRLASRSPSVPAAPVPPIAPVSVVTPLSLMVKLRLVPSDLTVSPRVIATPLNVVLAPKVTAPV